MGVTHGTRLTMGVETLNTATNPHNIRLITSSFNNVILHPSTLLPLFRSFINSAPTAQRELWVLTKDGTYSSKLTYSHIIHPRMIQRHPNIPWKLRIPSKVKLFLWLLSRDMLLTNRNLGKRNWPSGDRCVLCSTTMEEDADHLFFHYRYAQRIWYDILPTIIPLPITFSQLTHALSKAHLLGTKQSQLMAAACSNIWKEHNLRIFQDKRCGSTIHDDYLRDTVMGSDSSFFLGHCKYFFY
jgi:zinc-binding in reverse transcriptase